MANYTLTPNMSLLQPSIGVEGWQAAAAEINTSLSLVDGHDHSPGRGVQIGVAGISIQGDLALNGNNLTTIRALRMSALTLASLSASDNAALVTSGVDLYYRDGNGNNIRLTQSGNIVGTAGSISGLASPASASYVAGTGTFVWQSAASTAATMDQGPVILRYPAASAKGITITPPSGMGADYQLTLPGANPSTNNALTLTSTAGNQTYLTLGSANQILMVNGAGTGVAYTTQIQRSNLPLGNAQTSSSCGIFTTTSVSYVDVTNLSVTITTMGRPVIILLIPDGSSAANIGTNASGAILQLNITRGSTMLGEASYFATGTSATSLGSALQMVDVPTAGTYTYKIQAASTGGGGQIVHVANCKLVAVEL